MQRHRLDVVGRGNIAVVSVDKTEAIADSKRLVLICSTNALNSNMVLVTDEAAAKKILEIVN